MRLVLFGIKLILLKIPATWTEGRQAFIYIFASQESITIAGMIDEHWGWKMILGTAAGTFGLATQTGRQRRTRVPIYFCNSITDLRCVLLVPGQWLCASSEAGSSLSIEHAGRWEVLRQGNVVGYQLLRPITVYNKRALASECRSRLGPLSWSTQYSCSGFGAVDHSFRKRRCREQICVALGSVSLRVGVAFCLLCPTRPAGT